MKRLVHKKKLSSELFILAGILALALFLRVQGVASGLFAYTYDVGRDMLAVSAIIHEHKIPLIGPTTGYEGIFYGPWWYYLLTIPFVVFRGSPQGVSFFMALLGTIAVGISYYTGKRINGITLGVVFALLFAVSPILITSQIWNPYLAIPVIALLLFSLTYIFDTSHKLHKTVWFFTLGLCLGLILDSEIFFGMLFCAGTILALLIVLKLRLRLYDVLALLSGFILILLPRIFFDLRHQFLISKHFLYLLTHGVPQTHYTPFLSRLRYLVVEIFGQQWSNTVAASNLLLGGALFLFSIIFLVMFFRKNPKLEQNFFLYCSLVVAIFFLYFLTNSTDVFSHFIVGLPVLYVMFFAMCLNLLRNIRHGTVFLSIGVFLLIIINIAPWKIVDTYLYGEWQGDASVYKNQVAVLTYVYADAQGKPFRILAFTPNGRDDTYRYLFDWHGRQVHQTPDPSAKLAYYILEPDIEYKGYRLNIFKKQHEKDGKLIFEHPIAAGIAVQKREF